MMRNEDINAMYNCIIGTWSLYRKDGIYMCDYHNLKIKKPERYFNEDSCAVSASYICKNENGLLYMTDESLYSNSHKLGGGIVVFDPFDMECKQYIDTNRTLPCYISIVNTCNCILVSNYGYYDTLMDETLQDDVCVVAYKLNKQGLIESLEDVWTPRIEFNDPKGLSRLHCVLNITNTDKIIVCDIGKGMIHLLTIDACKLKYNCSIKNLNNPKPRYCVPHPAAKVIYVNDEETYKVCAYAYSDENELEFLEECSILDEKNLTNNDKSKQADLIIHPNGKYMYSLCRSNCSITMFSINEKGNIRREQLLKISNYKPRCMSFSLDCRAILVSCTENSCVLKIDIDSYGQISWDEEFKISCTNPAKVIFLEAMA